MGNCGGFLFLFTSIFAADLQPDGMEYKPQMVEIYGKDRGGLVHTSGKPQPQYKRVMAEELKEVADLITANTIFCTKEVLTSDEAARYLGISKSYLYKLTMRQAIPHYKPMGKMCYFNRLELEQWIQSNRVATADELSQQAQAYCMKKTGRK